MTSHENAYLGVKCSANFTSSGFPSIQRDSYEDKDDTFIQQLYIARMNSSMKIMLSYYKILQTMAYMNNFSNSLSH